MNKLPFRDYHLFHLLDAYEAQTLPLDLCIRDYFKQHKALGSKDRGFIAETAYAMIRWRSLLDYVCDQPHTWQQRYEAYLRTNLESIQQQQDIPLPIRLSFPEELFQLIKNSYGIEKAMELCRISNQPAPTTVRVNALKITRAALMEQWANRYQISPTKTSSEGIVFHEKINFFELPEFKQGFFEVQDEGSQLVAQLVNAKPGDLVLDYCAGSGGKTLAFAPKMQQKGQIYVHDIRLFALQEARKRLKRAGIQNAQTLAPASPHIEKLKKKMNWVLVDAPCTGTGTMRRNPDMKWKFTEQTLIRLVGQQRMIFEKALSFMHPEGRIIYVTCSILNEENQMQLDHFLSTYQLKVEGSPFQVLPSPGGMDGFFGVVLKR